MSVLIIDDSPQKYSRLMERLVLNGVDKSEVEITQCVFDARKLMENNYYDLIILDILIPFRAEEPPSYDNSILLIEQLLEDDTLVTPGRVVGITADRGAANEVSPIFNQQLWALISYSDSNDQWVDQIYNCFAFIKRQSEQPETLEYSTDLAIICALAEPELSAVLAAGWRFDAPKPVDETLFVQEGEFISNGKTLSVVAASCPRMGMVSMALTATKIIQKHRPKVIVMTGICAGIEGKTNYGDVIFSDLVWDWQAGKYIEDSQNKAHLAIGSHFISAPADLRAHIEQVRNDKGELLKIVNDWEQDRRGPLAIHIGPVASGSAVIATKDIVSLIQKQHRNVVGIEMEGYGLFASVHAACKPVPRVMSLKSVCDFADPQKNDQHQSYAAYTSARVMKLMFEKFGSELLK